jgi:hypothetical protein
MSRAQGQGPPAADCSAADEDLCQWPALLRFVSFVTLLPSVFLCERVSVAETS